MSHDRSGEIIPISSIFFRSNWNSSVAIGPWSIPLSSGSFFIYGADNIRDYGVSFYTFISDSVGVFLSSQTNMPIMFELMDELEAFVNKSELKT